MDFSSRPSAVKMYHYQYPNAGDLFAPMIIKEMFNIHAEWTHQGQADLVSTGSIIDHFSTDRNIEDIKPDPVHVWGSGYLRVEPDVIPLIRPLEVHALRGPLTKARVEATVGHPVDCPLADPGLLASMMPGLGRIQKDVEVGIIPHYQEKMKKVFYNLERKIPNVIFIDIQTHPRAFFDQLRRCRCVISTSLHGSIFADSFGIPNMWCMLSDHAPGWDYKFRDYYGSFGLDAEPYYLDEEPAPTPEQIKANYKIKRGDVERKQMQLLEAFPFRMGKSTICA